jgi:lipopolysaccharide/colanic/teichoic acid biosynthesis glycosyltransferase
VFIYKFRTMHPYSEYLQQYVFDLQGLEKGGKLENDFRMTTWGKWMRKLWLDELPMLYNWLKGDLGLVGVRPLSFQYLSLYDKDLQELRKKVRPGLVPPYYADLPENFEQICESERRYIKAFLARPVRTQIIYSWKAFVNIVLRGARSK